MDQKKSTSVIEQCAKHVSHIQELKVQTHIVVQIFVQMDKLLIMMVYANGVLMVRHQIPNKEVALMYKLIVQGRDRFILQIENFVLNVRHLLEHMIKTVIVEQINADF